MCIKIQNFTRNGKHEQLLRLMWFTRPNCIVNMYTCNCYALLYVKALDIAIQDRNTNILTYMLNFYNYVSYKITGFCFFIFGVPTLVRD